MAALRYIFTVTLLVLGLAALPHAFGRTTDVTMPTCKGGAESEHGLTAYAQWAHFTIRATSSDRLVIKNSQLPWGKWYRNGNKDDEIGSPDGTKIDQNNPAQVYSCGRSSASSGTEGSFEVWEDKTNGALATTVYWDCPWGSKQNTITVTDSPKYVAGKNGGNLDSGAIGDVTVTIVKIPSLSVV